MTRYNSVTHYATNVHGQPNTNASDFKYRTNWQRPTNATSKDGVTRPPTDATLGIYGKGNKSKRPVTLTAHDFKLNIPDCAYVTKVTFTVRMRCYGKLKVKAPYARFNIYNGKNPVETYRVDDTGWDSNIWYYNPNKLISSSDGLYEYVLTGKEFHRRGFSVSNLNDVLMGIDLNWYKSSNDVESAIYVDYITCRVDYEMPDPVLNFGVATSEDYPRNVTAGEEYDLEVYFSNRSNANCCNGNLKKDITFTLPPNAVVTEATYNELVSTYDLNTNTWTVPCKSFDDASIVLTIKDYTVGESKIDISSDFGKWEYWVYSGLPNYDVGEITVLPQIIQKGVVSCIKYTTTVLSNDGNVVIPVNVDLANNTNPNLTWSIDYEQTSADVTIDTDNTNDSQISLNLPVNKERKIVFNSCFIPSFTGTSQATATIGSKHDTKYYNSLAAPSFVVRNKAETDENDRSVSEIILNKEIITFKTHRVASSTELGAYIIDCGVADFDANMEVDDCTLTANTWEKLDYIGMIPLEYHHYDPKSTYENKGISESYKNKTYKGKEGIIDEDISLNFKIRPYQAPTLQGLVKLDKPTPINANHKCFEGDVLNHRGWVVLSKAEIERTNPLWYDVKATVDYITHDINTKFQIFNGLKVYNGTLPDVQADVFGLGENLATGLDIFNVDTDGGFVYDADGEDGAKNIFSLDNGQHLLINTRNSLSPVANIRFDWYTSRNSELRENKISRIFRLRDKDGNSIFEYEYTDFVFDGDYVTCTAIARYLTKDGGWISREYIDVDLKTELEAEPITPDEEEEETIYESDFEGEDESDDSESEDIDTETDKAYEEGYIAPSFNTNDYDVTLVYGSSLFLELNQNKLSFIDEGYNGREATDTIELINGEYSFETYWVNNNTDGTSPDIISYIDVNLSETVLNTQYTEQYNGLIVSPFPIPYKKLVFTRESEEGTIYYYNDVEPFKYMLEPYYQYHCGCDLVTREGTSIFDLNNSYTYFYIENGLVRLGFNKYNGRLYLSKWSIQSKEWVTTHYFQLSNDTIFSLVSYSDDKIVIKAGTDTYFTIWRGHPYILIQNPTDTIKIDSHFNYALGDYVDGTASDYPMVHSFLNTDNLLPTCVGGKTLKADCITVDDDDIHIATDHDIALNIPTLTALADNTLGVTLTPSTTDGTVHYLVDGVDIGSAESPFSLTTDVFKEAKEYNVQAIYTGDDDDNVAFSEVVTVVVNAPEPTAHSKADDGTPESQIYKGKYKLEIISAPKQFTYRDKQKIKMLLTRGGKPMPNMVVEKQLPNSTVSEKTDVNGIVEIENDNYNFSPAKYKWGGRFYDNWDTDGDKKLLYTAFRWIEVVKATPTFSHNGVDGKVSKGKKLKIKLNGVDSQANPSVKGLTNKSVTYSVDGGSKKSVKTNENGKFYVIINSTGTHKVKCMWGGDSRYKGISKTFTIKVI